MVHKLSKCDGKHVLLQDLFDCVSCSRLFTDSKSIKTRLEYLRGEIQAQRISWGEIAELQSLVEYIGPDDTELLEWAGVAETV